MYILRPCVKQLEEVFRLHYLHANFFFRSGQSGFPPTLTKISHQMPSLADK